MRGKYGEQLLVLAAHCLPPSFLIISLSKLSETLLRGGHAGGRGSCFSECLNEFVGDVLGDLSSVSRFTHPFGAKL